ncbi:response regulator [Ferruginibacter sp.]|uniref:response regulator n=1 Tax=Ferruginibacter sp. TaxID=1940288 RepID=UPI0026596493|nr:response regulator [Ferruginibacter sp.]
MKPNHILLVEDNEGDIFLLKEALEERKIVNKLSIARDGLEAVDFLQMGIVAADKDLPDLILLDINLPRMNGHEVLKFIKINDHLKRIPVIILSTSSNDADIITAYNNHANCFITKPSELTDFFIMMRIIETFWFGIVRLPNESSV